VSSGNRAAVATGPAFESPQWQQPPQAPVAAQLQPSKGNRGKNAKREPECQPECESERNATSTAQQQLERSDGETLNNVNVGQAGPAGGRCPALEPRLVWRLVHPRLGLGGCKAATWGSDPATAANHQHAVDNAVSSNQEPYIVVPQQRLPSWLYGKRGTLPAPMCQLSRK